MWSLIGMIYAPLYVVLYELLSSVSGGWATVLAAAAAGGIGAAFYGARQLALTASLVGVSAGLLLLLVVGPDIPMWQVATATAALGLLTGAVLDFPNRCTANVGVKFAVGAGMSTVSGLVLTGIVLVVGGALPVAAAVALLVSVTGVLYVATLSLLPARERGGRPRFCSIAEGLVIAVIACFVATGLAAFADIFSDASRAPLTDALLATAGDVPPAVIGGVIAGAVTGGLLELFEFSWVDRF
ncbi:MAG: hypothetical protein K9M02_04735 [Thiohalocapsa sp.]|nr:hypothetical protein [Thiohalocapsa sp.]